MLFENNDYFDRNDFNDALFLRGNMFDNEFVPFKNLSYLKPTIRTKKEKCLYDLMKYSFAINDYGLYLDLFPEDTKIFSKYKMACKNYNELLEKYENTYGPLEWNDTSEESYKWVNGPWPWQGDDSKYV